MSGRPPVQRQPLRRLYTGPPPAPDRIFYHNVWLRGPNSPQIEGLIPRLRRLDCYLTMVSNQFLLRAVEFRALMAPGVAHQRNRLVVGRAGRRYRSMLAHRSEQIAYFPGRIVAQLDDPAFSPKEVELLNRPNVAVFVMTSDRAVERFRSMGVDKPSYVLPLGSEVESLSDEAIAAVARRWRRVPDEVVVGYIASTLRLDGDRHAEEPLHNVGHLLELWEEVRGRAPSARLWLIGAASDRLRERVRGRDDILLMGTVPQPEALPYVANFDIALYPRAKDQGVRASKIADYLGAGVPTVSYDYEVVGDLRESGAGLLAETPADFVDAVVRLVDDAAERRHLAEFARRAGAERDWRVLIPRFEREVLDVYLP